MAVVNSPTVTQLEVRYPESVDDLLTRFKQVRQATEEFCGPLATEDYIIQSMEDVSPTKWHIAHTSWFFETFILKGHSPGYVTPNELYSYLFNSYYVGVGQRHCRPKRGLLSRPTVAEVFEYRAHIDAATIRFIENLEGDESVRWAPVLDIGINHEQQHQELMVTDIKHNFSINPCRPAYQTRNERAQGTHVPLIWVNFSEGVYSIGHDGYGFAFDNESPQHRVFLEPFSLASRLVTNAEYIEFIEDGGYDTPSLWLSEGWSMVEAVPREKLAAPLYWEQRDGEWLVMTMYGLEPVSPHEPVCHISYYEADAFATWMGVRLPTEHEWEVASAGLPVAGNFAENGLYHPLPLAENGNTQNSLAQMFGDVWEWTQSHYSPYPGYQAPTGAIGEYNGKFMANQFVLRGGSCATPVSHIRSSYRNFFHADSAWQFSGMRLAKSL